MSWLKKDLTLLSRTAEEEFYEALAQTPDPGLLGRLASGGLGRGTGGGISPFLRHWIASSLAGHFV